jgi:ABC-type microcin C transport system duplicated ATPase subunit YejF
MGLNLVDLSEPAMRSVRGKEIAMVFQDPMTALNPAHRVGEQIAESLRVHGVVPESSAGRWKSGGEGSAGLSEEAHEARSSLPPKRVIRD